MKKGTTTMTDQEEYVALVEAMHDAALAIDGNEALKVLALINVAVEAALAIYGQERGREWLIDNLKKHIAAAEDAGVGTPAYYPPAH
jgi:uncharacterized protein (UPF0218 family)